MRRLLLSLSLLFAVATASAQEQSGSSFEMAPADSPATMQAPLREGSRQRFLPMQRRMDREIGKIRFAYKGETALGLTVSYGTLTSDDTNFMLIANNINANGSIFTVNPSVGYFFKDNLMAGFRFGYTNLRGSFSGGLNLEALADDVDFSVSNVELHSNALSFGLYLRSYAGLDAKGTFAVFGEVDLSMRTGTSRFAYNREEQVRAVNGRQLRLALGFNPGLAVYILPNVCSTISFGLGGIEYAKIRQTDDEGKAIGSRTASRMRFRVDLLNINVGMTIHLWNKKANGL